MLLCREPVPSALFHFCGKILHGLLSDDPAFASRQGSLRFIDCGEDLRAAALAFFPQSKGFLDRIFLALKPSALNCLTDKRLLVWGELHFHRLQSMGKHRPRQASRWNP